MRDVSIFFRLSYLTPTKTILQYFSQNINCFDPDPRQSDYCLPNLHILSDGDKFCPKDMWVNLQTDLQNHFDKVLC